MLPTYIDAAVAFQQGELDKSKKICLDILKNNPKNIDTLILLSVIAFQTNNLDKSLEILNRPCNIIITTDSQYVKNGITQWIYNWKKNGWKTANKKPVKNKSLWIRLDEVISGHKIQWEWIKGHSGHPQNERADELANLAIENLER